MSCNITNGTIIENSSAVLLARVRDDLGHNIEQADVESITCKVFDKADESLISEPEIVIADVVFDALQTDARWTRDSTGYNFAVTLDGDNFPEGDATYRVEIKVTPTDGAAFYVLFDLDAVNIYSE